LRKRNSFRIAAGETLGSISKLLILHVFFLSPTLPAG